MWVLISGKNFVEFDWKTLGHNIHTMDWITVLLYSAGSTLWNFITFNTHKYNSCRSVNTILLLLLMCKMHRSYVSVYLRIFFHIGNFVLFVGYVFNVKNSKAILNVLCILEIWVFFVRSLYSEVDNWDKKSAKNHAINHSSSHIF